VKYNLLGKKKLICYLSGEKKCGQSFNLLILNLHILGKAAKLRFAWAAAGNCQPMRAAASDESK